MTSFSENPSSSLTSALFVAAMLLCFCSLGKGPSPGQFLVFSDDGVPPWMDLLQGVKSMPTQQRHIITETTAKPDNLPSEPIESERLFPGITKAMEDLTQHVSVLRAEDKAFDKYIQSVEDLRNSFDTAFVLSDGETKTRSHLILAWLYRLEEDFQTSLQKWGPLALVILAHYMVIFMRLESSWYVEGWAKHVQGAVRRDLHPAYERWLQWPVSNL